MKTSIQILSIIFLYICSSTNVCSQDQKFLYTGGTNWQTPFYNIINSNDPSVFKQATFETETKAQMWDRDANYKKGAWTKPVSWIFKLDYTDQITAQIRIRKRDFTKAQAIALANKYGQKMGQLPACLREGVKEINIMKSDALFGGNNSMRSIDITIGATSELYEKTGNMEETLFHEATHAALDYLYKDGKWNANRDKDPLFISQYATNNPNREDISESFLIYTLLSYKSGRVSKAEIAKIKKAISHRLEFYKNMKLNMHPIEKSEKQEAIEITNADKAAFNKNKYYRLTTQFTGEGKSLDVINDKAGNKLQLAKTGNYSGQSWRITPLNNGYYRLTTQFKGEGKSLDVINDKASNRLQLANTGNYSGQHWKIEKLKNGYYRLTSQFKGTGKSLDIVNDAYDNKIILNKTGNYTGQYWKITEVK